MKKALIIHGWEGNPKDHWFQEEKKILESIGYKVSVPDMPNTFHPEKDKWVKVVQDFDPDENSVVIGHSLGVPTILRYLEATSKKVDKVILLAGFADDLGKYVKDHSLFEPINNFIDAPFDWRAIKKNVNKIVIIHQRDDEVVPRDCGMNLAEKTGAKLILVEGTDHFDQINLNLINGELK